MQDTILIAAAVLVSYQIYLFAYFRGEKFLSTKCRIEKHANDCNALNEHIEKLKSSYLGVASTDYGAAHLSDASNYNMRRRKWAEEARNHRTHNCSSAVVKNASNQPFKYFCKYFNIDTTEESLSKFEAVLNDFSAAEQGKVLLRAERESIVASVSGQIPAVIRMFSRSRLVRELGFNDIDFSHLYFPVYTFQYISAGGNSSSKSEIRLDVQNLNGFVRYLGELIKFRKSIRGQRLLMTSDLRERIKARDNFTCQMCEASVAKEKNLLLEIDHIVPLSKGGMTTEENLQALCWRCNRTKGSKVLSNTSVGSFDGLRDGGFRANESRVQRAPNPSIERTSSGKLRLPMPAPHVKR